MDLLLPTCKNVSLVVSRAIAKLSKAWGAKQSSELAVQEAVGTGRRWLLLDSVAAASFICNLPSKGEVRKFKVRSYELLGGDDSASAKGPKRYELLGGFQYQGADGIATWMLKLCQDLRVAGLARHTKDHVCTKLGTRDGWVTLIVRRRGGSLGTPGL